MKIVSLIQGTPEWHAHRASHFNASDAPAMLGLSPYKSRAQLVRELATGAGEEIDAETQRRFDDGHLFEALARPVAEQIIGHELYPVVGSDGPYSASFDGLTLLGDMAFEHKSLNDALRAAMVEGCTGADLPELYQVQMEHQLMVSDEADRVLFMASKWKKDGQGEWQLVEERHCWYTPNPELRARVVTGWAQLEADVAAFEPAPTAAHVPAGRAPETLPALSIQVTGMVTASNLAEFKENALAVLGSINRELESDEDFANAEKTVSWCKGVEERLEATKQQVLGQTADIDAVFRTMDDVSAETRKIRLELDKLVTKRKEERRTEIANKARLAVDDHIRVINETLGAHALPMPPSLVGEISAAMKGKRSLASMQDAVGTVANNAKISASQAADRIRANVAILAQHADHAALFPDNVQLCASKSPDDLRNLVAARISAHQQAEEAKRAAALTAAPEQAPAPAQQPAAADAPSAAAPAPLAFDRTSATAPERAAAAQSNPGQLLKLGDINARISPLTISADGLRQLGFAPASTERGAKLYAADDLPAICARLIHVLRAAAAGESYSLAA
jgi:putative phage-type endonuclease